jgi:hypothetical protein
MASDEGVREDSESQDKAEPQSGEEVVVKLLHPIKYGEQTISELTFNRRPKAKDFMGITTATGALSFDDQFMIVARLVSEPVSVIHELDIADMGRVMKTFTSFIPDGLTIGGNQ